MQIDRMVDLLEIEHECMLRKSHEGCDGKCDTCELAQEDDELHEMYTDVISLLKAQEPVKPMRSSAAWQCGNCLIDIGYGANYCYNCGRAVKWDV